MHNRLAITAIALLAVLAGLNAQDFGTWNCEMEPPPEPPPSGPTLSCNANSPYENNDEISCMNWDTPLAWGTLRPRLPAPTEIL